jgi:class 3 adenylate cyclase
MQKVLAIGTATARQASPAAEARVVEFPGTPERAGRTFVCSVLFLDIAEYSKRPVGEQLQIKERFNAHVSQAIGEIPAQHRIILDTGDGVAISFLDDPEDALCVALALARSFAAPAGIPVRAGINLGPVRLTRDINGQPNIIGDGINVAQRVMSFAQPGKLLVSRAFHEVISRLTEEYAALFSYQGSRTDKHVREHEIFELSAPTARALEVAERRKRARRRKGEPAANAALAAGARLMARRGLAVGATGISLAALGAALMAFLQPDSASPPEPPAVAAHAPPPAAPAPAAPDVRMLDEAPESRDQHPQPSAPGSAGKPAGPAAKPAQGRPGAVSASDPTSDSVPAPATRAQREPAADDAGADTRSAPASSKPRASAGAPPAVPATTLRTATGPTALVLLAISPWGEVYVDGKSMGVSPPLAELELAPGRHRIEVRNGGFKPYQEDVQLGSNETVRIKHKFTYAR